MAAVLVLALVEPVTRVENTQLTDSENASIAENAMISKSAVQRLYKDCLKFPELQPSDLSLQMRSTLKSSSNIYTLVPSCMLLGSPSYRQALFFHLLSKVVLTYIASVPCVSDPAPRTSFVPVLSITDCWRWSTH